MDPASAYRGGGLAAADAELRVAGSMFAPPPPGRPGPRTAGHPPPLPPAGQVALSADCFLEAVEQLWAPGDPSDAVLRYRGLIGQARAAAAGAESPPRSSGSSSRAGSCCSSPGGSRGPSPAAAAPAGSARGGQPAAPRPPPLGQPADPQAPPFPPAAAATPASAAAAAAPAAVGGPRGSAAADRGRPHSPGGSP
eukprot:TRINITY_DN16339_c0_g1_i4.p2 TRINITY_DN16339_c0_g1~~TRINITY_DN16339_c0_g1_i4.p2  ORF type:complete len:195 (+),score=19.92 TRINITY_DN16339_c0_g1_i4:94-678(+)